MTHLETLKNSSDELWGTIIALNKHYYNIVDNLLIKYFPDTKWHVTSFDKDHVHISINLNETYSDGSFKKYTIEINHGYSSCFSRKDDERFHLNINPFTAGSFTLLENNSLREYYGMVGNICSNEEFRNELIDILKTYYIEFKPINEKYYKVEREINSIKRDIAEQERLAQKNETYNTYKTAALANTDGYFVIDTDESCITDSDERIIYRKKPVKILAGPMNYDDAYAEMCSYYKSKYNKYKVVEVSKIKFTE